MRSITVKAASPYEVVIGSDLTHQVAEFLAEAPRVEKVMVVFQPTVAEEAAILAKAIEASGLNVSTHQLPDAEEGKTLHAVSEIWDHLGADTFARGDAIVSVGGGAATDVAGFAAATWMRGIKVVHVPTSLLAMVDAAVGGKTGINTAAGKNLVGAFHEPAAVFVDVDHVRNLPREELISGSAEMIKCGFIADPEILAIVEANPDAALRLDGQLSELIARSIAVKAKVVSEDLKEAGQREILNYGHTFGHAVELEEDYRWRHGNAVAVGMMFVAHLAAERGLIDRELVERHRNILESVGLPVTYGGADFESLYAAMTRDKKNRDGHIRFVGLTDVGEPTRIEGPSIDELRRAYEAIAR